MDGAELGKGSRHFTADNYTTIGSPLFLQYLVHNTRNLAVGPHARKGYETLEEESLSVFARTNAKMQAHRNQEGRSMRRVLPYNTFRNRSREVQRDLEILLRLAERPAFPCPLHHEPLRVVQQHAFLAFLRSAGRHPHTSA
jgi:hypothetical protein